MRDPEAFQRAVELGQINLQLVENVRACTLSVGKFYLQRPPTLDTPFVLVKVVRIVIDDDTGLQWGAFVHPWELSTTGPDLDYFTDPWHASAAHKESQRFNVRLGVHDQGPAWTYPLSVLTEFQDEVALNAAWSKPRYAHTPRLQRAHSSTCCTPFMHYFQLRAPSQLDHSFVPPHTEPGKRLCAQDTA